MTPRHRPDIPLFSRWRHVDGEECVIVDVVRDSFKSADGKWADVVVYGVEASQRRFHRVRPDFLERFTRLRVDVVPG